MFDKIMIANRGENADFADSCAAAGIDYVGPSVRAIRAIGMNCAAKTLMEKTGLPLTPDYHGDNQDAQFLRSQADAIGYPVPIKASPGCGGKGMRVVERHEDFAAALASCQREATSSFANASVLIEKYVLEPRHIEIKTFSDTQGSCVDLFERVCSVQRRHQKVLEKAPARGMTAERRGFMGRAAVDAAKAVDYLGAGTVEFIVDQQGDFYFMETNTQLQVEPPGRRVDKGAPLKVLEAMQMEHTMAALADGMVKSFQYAIGDQVADGAELVDFELGTD
jgi:3-methylcrotonyl-CoA carboxylase alpha subunit